MRIREVTFDTLHAQPFICGPIANNTYALFDEESKDCVIIDPSFSFDQVLERVASLGYKPREYWLTHAHWDHFVGTAYPESVESGIQAHLHPDDMILFEEGIRTMKRQIPFIGNSPRPVTDLTDRQELRVGKYVFQALLTPGHAPGHCCFYCEQAGWLFSGDLVFYHSYGRTDLTGGNVATLMKSIRERVLTLPDDTLILPGHEDYTFVRDEKVFY